MRRRDMASGRLGTSRHAGLLPLGSLRSEWYLRAFRWGCDYGGSGYVLRVPLWYHPARLRHHRVVVLACYVFSLTSWYLLPSLARGFSSRVYPFARCPVASTPARLPPPPLSGGGGRGELVGGDWGGGSDACFEIRLEAIGGTVWLQFWGAAGTYLLASRAVHHCGGHG